MTETHSLGCPAVNGGGGAFEPMVRQRVRIRFAKQDDLRLLGHRDLVRALERLFRRAGARLAMSQGFHPKPRMHFPSALALGVDGLDEVLEVELEDPLPDGELARRLTAHAAPGLRFHSAETLPSPGAKAQLDRATYAIAVPEPRWAEAAERVSRLLAADSWPVSRPDKPAAIDLRPLVEELALDGGRLRMRLRARREGSIGPRDVLAALGLDDLEASGSILARTGVEVQP